MARRKRGGGDVSDTGSPADCSPAVECGLCTHICEAAARTDGGSRCSGHDDGGGAGLHCGCGAAPSVVGPEAAATSAAELLMELDCCDATAFTCA